jgi:hypothetical protein
MDRAGRLERRRRMAHLRRLRRDLLEDVLAATVLTILALSMTAGLGVIAILEAPLVLALLGSIVIERRRRGRGPRRRGTAPRAARRAGRA